MPNGRLEKNYEPKRLTSFSTMFKVGIQVPLIKIFSLVSLNKPKKVPENAGQFFPTNYAKLNINDLQQRNHAS